MNGPAHGLVRCSDYHFLKTWSYAQELPSRMYLLVLHLGTDLYPLERYKTWPLNSLSIIRHDEVYHRALYCTHHPRRIRFAGVLHSYRRGSRCRGLGKTGRGSSWVRYLWRRLLL